MPIDIYGAIFIKERDNFLFISFKNTLKETDVEIYRFCLESLFNCMSNVSVI